MMSRKLYYAPAVAVQYVGANGKDFAASLARPKPVLNHGDIIITDKRTAYNLTNKGFGQYESVESIEIPDADELLDEIKRLNDELETSKQEGQVEVTRLNDECERLKGELAKALEFLSEDDETVNTDEVPPVDETVNTDEVPPVDETVNTDEVPPVDETVNTDEVPPVDETANTDEVPPVDETVNTDEVPPVDETAKNQKFPEGKIPRKNQYKE